MGRWTGLQGKSIEVLQSWSDIHVLEVVEHLVLILIVPLGGDERVEAVDGGQSVHHVGAEERVDVVSGEFTGSGPVLCPVGHVTHQLGGCG